MMKKYILGSALCLAIAGTFVSCSKDDELDSTSIFQVDPEVLDPTSPTYNFDKWVTRNYRDRYNMTFTYRMKSLATDPDYNLVPASLDKAKELAVLTKYLWYDVYDVITGDSIFLGKYGPKMLHIIGSAAVNPSTGTEILGLAEGGLKVSLFVVNKLDPENAEQLNAMYFKTMHHEFSHILHQTKTYPQEFDRINAAHYEPNTWQERIGGTTCSLGFSSPYASGQAREDFAETCANYITRTKDEWDFTMWCAGKGWKEIDDIYVTWDLMGMFNDAANYDALMDKYTFCYWYNRNNEEKDKGFRTYIGQFVEKDQVYYLTDMELTVDKDNSAHRTYTQDGKNYFEFYNFKGGKEKFKTGADFEKWLKKNYTDRGIEVFPVEDTDGQDGAANLEKKVSIVREWFASAWNIDLDELRDTVQSRQSKIDITKLLAPIDNPATGKNK